MLQAGIDAPVARRVEDGEQVGLARQVGDRLLLPKKHAGAPARRVVATDEGGRMRCRLKGQATGPAANPELPGAN